ncbi:MAG: MopE-related protein [bacterium]
MLKKISFTGVSLTLLLPVLLPFFLTRSIHAASVGSDGGITVSLSYSGDLDSDMVTDNDGHPILDDEGNQWQARDKLEHDLGLFAQHVFEMSEGKQYIRRVLISNEARAWASADIRWDMGAGTSTATLGGWTNSLLYHLNIRRGWRTSIHDVASHEFGHYFYGLSDEYAKDYGYYSGHFPGGPNFDVRETVGDPVTVMNANTPHQFCDHTDHEVTIEYTHPDTGTLVTQTLTPALLDDGDPDNDGPINNWINQLYALDGWAVACLNHTDMIGHHTDGVRPVIDFSTMPEVELRYVEHDGTVPGRILLLDRSGSMSHEEYGIPASQYVQEAGMFLYHSSEPDDYIGTFAYNHEVDTLFGYDHYNSASTLDHFLDPTGLTDIHLALETALDTFEATHGADHIAGAEIFLMSDGKQTTGDDLWTQVERARDAGVVIHTFSYGDADETTMQNISTETSGDNVIMSENDGSLMNLKMGIVKSIARKRGWSAMYNYFGTLEWKALNDNISYSTVSFRVPENSKDVKFYLFPESVNVQRYSFSMANPPGTSTYTSSLDNTQSKGRFLGKKAKSPQSGQWTVNIMGTRQTGTTAAYAGPSVSQGRVYLLAYIDNPDINAQVWLDKPLIHVGKDYPKVPVYASVSNKYLLTKANAVSRIYDPNGVQVGTIEMSDSGKNGDKISQDGIYTGILDTSKLVITSSTFATAYFRRVISRFTIKTSFAVTESSVPAPNTEYEYGTDYKAILKSFKPSKFDAYAEVAGGLTQTSYQPYLSIKLDKSIIMEQGKRYQEWITIGNASPGAESLRINLGQGIKVGSITADRTRENKYLVEFIVSQNALLGKRDLSVQFGNTVLTKSGYAEIIPGVNREICDGRDNDGDGKIDEDLVRACSTACGSGTEVCQKGKWVGCTAPQPQAEVCDGKDNDCDGKIDEDLVRACSTACGSGTEVCQRGQWVGCTAPQPQAEVCDGKDNDCDGKIDEDLTKLCSDGKTRATCLNGQWVGCPGPQLCQESDSGELDVPGVEGKKEGEVRIPVRIQSASRQISSLGFEFTYDPTVLEYLAYERGDLVTSFNMFDVSKVNPGRLRIAGISTASGIPKKASGYIVWLKFKVTGGTENMCYLLGLEKLADELTGLSSSHGCFCIRTNICTGDLNADGAITPKDALIAFQCYLGLVQCQECVDVNQDGTYSPADALCLFKKYLGQPSCLD